MNSFDLLNNTKQNANNNKKSKYCYYFLFAIIYLVSFQNSYSYRNLDSRDLAVLIDVTVNNSPPSITLKWQKNELSVGYEVRRKSIFDEYFPQFILATLDTNTLTYTDINVKVGDIYEYEVRSNSIGKYNLNGTVGTNFIAFGYVIAGINANIQRYTNVALVIDETIAEPLSDEINRLKEDLVAEGLNVIELVVPRAEEFDKDKVKSVKESLTAINQQTPLKYIYLLGRVPVPYSGDIAPDGHVPDHKGAWPTDLYYGVFDETIWTDEFVNNTNGNREVNKNIPGDGKFDQNQLFTQSFQYYATAGVGRVDFFNMTEFTKSEIELLRMYLDKNHKFRTNQIGYTYKGLIDDNFNATGLPEAFASTGWRSLSALVGSNNVSFEDYFTKLGTEFYLWSYGTGPGSDNSAGGIGTTKDFATKEVKGIFTMLFGSYFGDWNTKNNLMRAAIASEPNTLTCSWSARPHWYYHHMGLGLPIGYSTLATVNNYNTYIPNYYIPSSGIIYASSMKGVHTALMGDPTLTMAKNYDIEEPKNLQVQQKGYKYIEIKWETPITGIIHNYNIYRSNDKYTGFKKVNKSLVAGNTYVDDYNVKDTVYYIVAKTESSTTNSGSFMNHSKGIRAEIIMSDLTGIEDNETLNDDFSFDFYPNPTNNSININYSNEFNTNNQNAKIELISTTGNIIKTYELSGNTTINFDLKSENLPFGIYFIQLTTKHKTITKKLVYIN